MQRQTKSKTADTLKITCRQIKATKVFNKFCFCIQTVFSLY